MHTVSISHGHDGVIAVSPLLSVRCGSFEQRAADARYQTHGIAKLGAQNSACAHHRVTFASSCLAVCKNRAIVALEGILEDKHAQVLKDAVLACVIVVRLQCNVHVHCEHHIAQSLLVPQD